MQEPNAKTQPEARRTPWNKGKMVGAKPPLRTKNVWSIRTNLQVAGRIRDLAMFNLAIDSKLRGCDVVALKVGDIAPSGYAVERATVRQKKTGRPVKFELTEQTRQAVDDYVKVAGKKPGEFLFREGDDAHALYVVKSGTVRVVNLDAEVPHGAFNFAVPKQKLYCAQITRPAVDQGCLRAP